MVCFSIWNFVTIGVDFASYPRASVAKDKLQYLGEDRGA
jgi:hypothetical protein